MRDRDQKDLLAAAKNSPQPQAASGRPRLWHKLFFIVSVALLLRLAVITVGHTYRITPRRDHFQFGWEMGRIARSIASGQGFSSPTDLPSGPSAWAPPVYPYLLAGVFWLFGVYSAASAFVILAFNSIFGALTCIPLYRMAERMYGIGVARAAAWTWAVFPYAIYWPVRVVWETSLSAFLLSLVLLLTLRVGDGPPRRGRWIVFGLLWGVISLTNTALLVMLPFCLIWLWYRLLPGSGRWAGLGFCALAAVLVVSPWLARNHTVFGKFIFVRDNLPLEMHMANNDRLTGLWTRSEHPGNDSEAMRRFQELGELRFMEEKQQEVRQFIREHPGQFARFTMERAAYFWIGTPQAAIVAGYDLIVFRHTTFLLEAVLAFAGLWWTIRNRKHGAFLLTCLLIFYPLPYYLVNPFPRYKHPIEPGMTLLIVYLFYQARNVRLRWPTKLRTGN
jgi:4-amino-4-deoxy-L-arabinose transferase-like glycosyltransferase